MSETLSHSEQNNSAPNEWEATMNQYKQEHPNAVDDVEKARFMAGAEDALRTSATQHNHRLQELKQKIKDAFNRNSYETRSVQEEIEATQMATDEANRRADLAGQTAGQRYDEVHQTESQPSAADANNYKDIYPNAIDDVEKARAMAEAGDAIETTRAGHQRRLNRLTKQFDDAYDRHGNPLADYEARSAYEDVQVAQNDVAETKRMANNVENAAGRKYDQEH